MVHNINGLDEPSRGGSVDGIELENKKATLAPARAVNSTFRPHCGPQMKQDILDVIKGRIKQAGREQNICLVWRLLLCVCV